MQYLNPDMVWVTYPEFFDKAGEKDPRRDEKQEKLFEILDGAKARDIRIVLNAVPEGHIGAGNSSTLDRITKEYNPLTRADIGYGVFATDAQRILFVGAHLRHETVSRFNVCDLPAGYEADLAEDELFTSRLRNGTDLAYFLVGACVVVDMNNVRSSNRNTELIAYTGATLTQGDEIREDSFYRKELRLSSTSLIATVEKAYSIFEK